MAFLEGFNRVFYYLSVVLLLAFTAVAGGAPVPLAPTARLQAEAQFYRMQHSDASGVIKPDGLLRGIAQRRALITQQHLLAPQPTVAGLALRPAAGIAQTGWTALGPGNVGGRIRAILSDPNTGKLFVGAVSGGIWVSSDHGQSWSPVDDFMGSISVSTLAEDPTTGNLYAGTGEGFYNGDGIQGAGIFESTDHGVTWSSVASTNPSSDPSWFFVNDIAINGNGDILAATGGSVDTTSNYAGGVYLSTNGGSSWTKVYTGRSRSVAWDPNNASNAIFDATSDTGGASVIKYTTDGGSTWTLITVDSTSAASLAGHSVLAYAKSAPGVVYASVDQNGGEVAKSSDGGKTWSKLAAVPSEPASDSCTNNAYLCGQGWYANSLWVDPTDASHLIVGGLDLFQSTNGGASWSRISDWTNTPVSPHADHHAIVADFGFNGGTDTTVYFGNDGGLYAAANPLNATQFSGWTELNNGLAITQFYGGAGHVGVAASANGNIVPIIGGAQDNGTLLYSGNTNGWTEFYSGDGGACAVDPSDGNYLYGEYAFLTLARSTNGGQSAVDISSNITDAGSYANFIAPFVLDPNDSSGNTLYAGGASLWRSVNIKAVAPSFSSAIGSGLPADYTSVAGRGTYISAIAVAQGNANDIWVGYDNGSVYHQEGSVASPLWTQMGGGTLPGSGGGVPGRMVQSIVVQPNSTSAAETVYITFGGYSADNIWRGIYDGTSWTWTSLTPASSGFPQVPVYSLAIAPGDANWLYAGTDVGLFTSTDDGATWSTTNDGPANVRINQLVWYDTTRAQPVLLAVTHGRGMFKTTVSTGIPMITSLSPASVAAGGSGFALTVNGINFVNGTSVVQWNGASLPTAYVSATQLTATVSTADIATTGTVQVTVANGATVSDNYAFTVDGPTISSLNPTSAVAGDSGFTLTVNGSSFVSGISTVQWNGTPLPTTYVSATQLTAAVSAADIATAGTATVTVANGGSVSSGTSFSIILSPLITSLSPAGATAGGSAFTLTVNGINFVSGSSTVQWNGAPLSTSYVSATQLTAAVSAADIAAVGTVQVTVANGATVSANYAFAVDGPAISSLNPASVAAGGSGFTLTANGSGFINGVSTIQWNGASLPTAYVSSTQLTATVSAADIAMAGTATVTVANGGGVSSGTFFFIDRPIIASFTPLTVKAGGNAFTLTVDGSDFIDGISTVRWNSTSLATTYVSATQLTAVVSAADIATAGSVAVRVANGGNVSDTLYFTISSSGSGGGGGGTTGTVFLLALSALVLRRRYR